MNLYLQMIKKESSSVMVLMCAVMLLPLLMTTLSRTTSSAHTAVSVPAQPVEVIDFSDIAQTIELKGSMLAHSQGNTIHELTFLLRNVPGATPLDLADRSLQLAYRDQSQRVNNLAWQWHFEGANDHDQLLEAGELLQVNISLADLPHTRLGPNTAFALDILPPYGAPLTLQYRTPDELNSVIDLDQL